MHVPDIDLDLVRCFVTVVESGGFTQASKRQHLTQSAITLKIKRLEDLLGQRLFFKTAPQASERTPRKGSKAPALAESY
jgi:DNA-binding transcriptional LysR family regulator